MKTITRNQAKQLIQNDKGKFFGVRFLKKDGSPRTMNCKRVMKSDIKGTGTAKKNDHVIPVYSNNDRGYRSFDIDRLEMLKMGGEEYLVVGEGA
ncbi:hypothetical protein M316_0059 [Nitrincola phage 1M3-16]|uniref:hypothetical protein n=1 Tax=Nitrincola phage 1M3-16 TaxID=1472912 RepID=UPI000444EC1D|nr:hypothetical protein GJ22_gp093 [Nitrincola phage 1M3-16]AHX01124.1 hypothetical protein M316_0059 [Nitrincola phage 1M3-16]